MKNKQVVIRIVDDDIDFLNALSFLLETEGWKVEKYSNARDFFINCADSVPGCIILDVKMPEMTGLEAQHEFNKRGYTLPIIFLTAHGDIDMAVHTLHKGAVDFIQKPVNEDRLLKAISRAVKIDSLKRGMHIEPEAIREKFKTLTEREAQIAELLSEGLLNREISERLGISVRTVETHRMRIFGKLGANNISDLVQFFQLLHDQTQDEL